MPPVTLPDIEPKEWQDGPDGGTPTNAADWIDQEERMGAYAKEVAQAALDVAEAAAGAEEPVVFEQNSPSTAWVFVHNLGRPPVSIRTVDTGGTEVLMARHDDNDNQTTLTSTYPFAGKAYAR
jgi:hypothetical protein